MKEIRTRPKKRDIQTRQTTAFLPKQAAKVLREQAVRRQFKSKNNMPEEEQTSPYQEPVERFQTKEQRAAEISSRTAFRSGKALAQKQFDRKFSATKPKEQQRFTLCNGTNRTAASHPCEAEIPAGTGQEADRTPSRNCGLSWKSMKPHRCRRILQRWSSR